jgi:hypothetical protein
MSLSGITFANQKITPSDDGKLYGALLQDCILTGCGITFSAATLAIAAGALLIGTRELKTSGESLSISGATTGYARVIIDIDITKAATESSFLQAEWQIEYASSADGFGILEQQDINTSGTHYQAVFCTMSLGAAGITGIVSSMQTAALGTGIVNMDSMDWSAKYGKEFAITTGTNLLVNSWGYHIVWAYGTGTVVSLTHDNSEACDTNMKVRIFACDEFTFAWSDITSLWSSGDHTLKASAGSITVPKGRYFDLQKISDVIWILSGNYADRYITSGTVDPSGGSDGDIYLKYEEA